MHTPQAPCSCCYTTSHRCSDIETHESSPCTALAWSFHSVMSIQLNSHRFPLQPWVVGWGGICGSAAQKPTVFHWGKGQLSVLQGLLRAAAKLKQIPVWEQDSSVKMCVWVEFGVAVHKQGRTHNHNNPHVCVQLTDSSLIKHSISPHASFNWQFPLSEGHSQKVASGPKTALKSQVSITF